MNNRLTAGFATCLTLGLAAACAVAGEGDKKLIHLGIDTPDITDLPEVVSQLEEAPFDGWVFSATSDSPRGRERRFDFSWEGWSRRAFTIQELQPSIDALKRTRFVKLTDNFIRFCCTPADLDWFDNHDAVINNARLAGRFAKEAGLRGVVFDPEEYVGHLWDYHQQKHHKTRSFQEYAAQVRKRGAEVMQAFQADYPGITIFMLFGNSYTYYSELPSTYGGPDFSSYSNDPQKLEYFCYGLMAPFLDGMIEAAGPGVTIIDGTEHSYLTIRKKHFIQHRRAFEQHVLPFVADDEAYARVFRLGFGIWIDAHWTRDEDDKGFFDAPADGRTEFAGWSATHFDKNYFQPDELKLSLVNGLDVCDQYVWLYSERLYFYGPQKNVPPAYEQAIRDARAEAGLP